jgi:hypothetical protein
MGTSMPSKSQSGVLIDRFASSHPAFFVTLLAVVQQPSIADLSPIRREATIPPSTTASHGADALLIFACSDYEPPRSYEPAEEDWAWMV